jgi:hypothetical protein
MPDFLTPSSSGVAAVPLSRRQARAVEATGYATAVQIANVEAQKTVTLARVEAQAQVQAAKVHAVGFVGQQGLHAVAMLSQLESQLAQIVPAAVTRLQGVADLSALVIAEIVGESARKLG